MSERYDHASIEKKWQEKWRKSGVYKSVEDLSKQKSYVLDMFPYPSGEGLHVGHPKGYIATDIYSRYMRMQGRSVLHPMGWDAFGLPAENYALKNSVHPRVSVEKNIATFKSQLEKIGFDHDWSREINTTDPKYYKWTQWIFLKLFEKGLAYQSNEPINWCPSCMTGLANEDLEGGVCERCGSVIEKRALPQWVLKITDYADRLLNDLELLPKWPEHIKESQRNWIGRSEGAEIEFALTSGDTLKIFTTRPDTIFGATYMVVAPEHELVAKFADENVNNYVQNAGQKSEIERTAEGKEKTGILLTGVRAINPATKEEVPIWVADYVLGGYGTGAIMAVPAHDERDRTFAEKFDLPIKDTELDHEAWKKFGTPKIQYKLKDWVFSRQRYWGEPIPIIHCEKDGAVAVPEKDLPVTLPEVEKYEPSGTGESPLSNIEKWVNTTCPQCGGPAKRETNTMPQWAGSSWYYLRYMDPSNEEALVAKEREKYWSPVDMYVGGAEHATRHLIYARFWHKFLYDIGVVSTLEPFEALHSVGLIIAEDGRKMSKRFQNVINPDDIVAEHGADTLRVYEMFMGPFENAIAWNTKSLIGSRRFIERVWRAQDLMEEEEVKALTVPLNQTIKKVGDDILAFKFNTAISQMMIFLNALEEEKHIGRTQWRKFLQVLAPFAPHLTEELWSISESGSIHISSWPKVDLQALVATQVRVAVQVNGKVRGTIELAPDASEEEALSAGREVVKKWLGGGEKKAVYVPGRVINLIV